MKKLDFIVIMIVETMVALLAMGLLFSDVGAMIYPISLAVFAVVLAPFALWLKKTEEEAKKRKIRTGMALIMLIPIAVGLVTVAYVVTMLFLSVCFYAAPFFSRFRIGYGGSGKKRTGRHAKGGEPKLSSRTGS